MFSKDLASRSIKIENMLKSNLENNFIFLLFELFAWFYWLFSIYFNRFI